MSRWGSHTIQSLLARVSSDRESLLLLRRFSQDLLMAEDLPEIFSNTHRFLSNLCHFDHMKIYLSSAFVGGEGDIFIQYDYATDHFEAISRMQIDNPIVGYFRDRSGILLKQTAPSDEIINALESLSCDVSIPIFSADKLIGLILLGPNVDWQMQVSQDKIVFDTAAFQLSMAVHRFKMKRDYDKSVSYAEDLSHQSAFLTLTQSIVHEIKNPLGMLLSRSELVLSQLHKPEVVKEFADMIQRNILRLLSIIDRVLHYKTMSPKDPELFAVNELVEELIILIQTKCEQQEINITFECDNELNIIFADKNCIFQALLNVFVNAIQAMQNGGELFIRVENSGYRDANNKKRDGVCIMVEDTGRGIAEHVITDIFKPFYTTKEGNSGLGLSLVTRVVYESNGIMDVMSEEHKGTGIFIYLPTSE